MSSSTPPITPARFAEALKGLSISSLHLKVLELRNNIAHLEYSNEQLRPFAQGLQQTTTSTTSPSSQETTSSPQPDQDCIDAIQENEQVIARMQERIDLIRTEVQDRGQSWTEFQTKEEADAIAAAARAAAQAETTNGTNGYVDDAASEEGAGSSSSPWTDGTFQTGVVRNGQLVMDGVVGQSVSRLSGAGGSISDEELRRRMEEQLRNLGVDGDEEEGGLHL